MVIIKSESSEMRLKDLYDNHLQTINTSRHIFSKPVIGRQKEEQNLHITCAQKYDSNATLESTGSGTSFSSASHHHKRRKSGDTMSLWSSTRGFKADISSFQSTEQQKTLIRKNLQFYGTVLFILAVLAAAFTIVDTQITINLSDKRSFFEDTLKNLTKYNLTKKFLRHEEEEIQVYECLEIGLKSFISMMSLATCIALYFYYHNLYQLKIVRHFYPRSMSFLRATPLLKKFLIECLVCFVHVPPLMTTHANFPARLQLIVLIRLYLLGRYLKEKHELMNSPSTRFLASVTKTDLTSMFLFKTFFMQYPFQLILLAYIILLFIGGYSVWLLEKRYTYLDTVWMLIITMTTVGFGDLTPKSIFGRFIVGLAAIAGIFLMALFISLVNEALMLQRREKRILAYVENQDHTRFRKVTALNTIGSWYKYFSFVNKHMPSRDSTSESLISKLHHRHGKVKVDLFALAKAKILETQMFKAINQWRKVKEVQVSGYFAQEFMIEDMKIMMVDLTAKVGEIEKKMNSIAPSFGDTSDMAPSTRSKNQCKPKKCESRQSNGQIGKKSIGREFQTNTDHSKYKLDLEQGENDFYFEADRKMNDTVTCVGTSPLSKLLHENKNCERTSKHLQGSDVQMAFKLLQNQAKIMNSALDDIYYKTKQEISDLENIVSSLLICSAAENKSSGSTVKDLKV